MVLTTLKLNEYNTGFDIPPTTTAPCTIVKLWGLGCEWSTDECAWYMIHFYFSTKSSTAHPRPDTRCWSTLRIRVYISNPHIFVCREPITNGWSNVGSQSQFRVQKRRTNQWGPFKPGDWARASFCISAWVKVQMWTYLGTGERWLSCDIFTLDAWT